MSAANTDKLRKGTNNFSTTLSGLIGASDTTISLASTTNLPTDTAVDLVIDRVDSSGNLTPSTREYIKGVVSGTNIINVVRAQGNSTGLAHSTGAVVECVFTHEAWNDHIDAHLQDHVQLGYHSTLTDINGKTWLGQTATASAVNYLNLANAATGGVPLLQAAGSDSNIGLHIAGKGTSSPHFYGYYDGWVNPNETPTYQSVDDTNRTAVINVASIAKFDVGNRIKLTNGGNTIYAIITSLDAVNNRVTYLRSSDSAALANSAITNFYFSREKSPSGFPLDPAKWTVSVTSSATTGLTGSWSNAGAINLSIPIGAWEISANATVNSTRSSTTANEVSCMLSESATAVTSGYETTIETINIGGATGTITTGMTFTPSIDKTYTAATTIYLDFITVATSGALYTSRGNVHGIRAVCYYL